jgi:hypothetical protein
LATCSTSAADLREISIFLSDERWLPYQVEALESCRKMLRGVSVRADDVIKSQGVIDGRFFMNVEVNAHAQIE